MANNNDFNQTVASLFKGMDAFLTTKTIVGEPIQVGDVTIIPLSDVNFGIGAGAMAGSKGANSAAGGMGGKLSPSSITVIKNGYAQVISASTPQSNLGKVLEMIPGLADKISAKINKKAPTDEEMDAVNDLKDSLGDEEFKLED